jgi:hypothetical protein
MEKKNYIIVTNSNDWVGGGLMDEAELQEEINSIKEWYLEPGSNETVEFFAYEIIGTPIEFK